MRIKDFLNEFEADRAALPGVEKETLAKLRNKTIVISGGELARCLCYAFLYNNEAKRLGIKVILLGKSRNAMASYHSELLLRDDFDFVDYNSASEISSADYVITTGVCGEHTDNNPQIMIDGIAEINACAKIACETWMDVRTFGQVFAFKGEEVSFGVRGPVSIHQAVSLSPVDNIRNHLALGFEEQRINSYNAQNGHNFGSVKQLYKRA